MFAMAGWQKRVPTTWNKVNDEDGTTYALLTTPSSFELRESG
jgi:hypothetical protein